MQNIAIQTEYITLGQFLKLANCVETGGHAKFFLQEHTIYVNDLPENRRGKKLYPNDTIKIENLGEFQVIHS
jgi:ribosome-associated protein